VREKEAEISGYADWKRRKSVLLLHAYCKEQRGRERLA
jgi:hypothetical protein